MLHKVRLLRFLKVPWLRPRFGSRVIFFTKGLKRDTIKMILLLKSKKKKKTEKCYSDHQEIATREYRLLENANVLIIL